MLLQRERKKRETVKVQAIINSKLFMKYRIEDEFIHRAVKHFEAIRMFLSI